MLDQSTNNNNCPHNIKTIKVVKSICCCETTVIICGFCKRELTKPVTDC